MKLAIIIALVACGGGNKAPMAAPEKPKPAAESTAPAPESALRREVTELANQNAASEAAIAELATNIQTLDDSDDPIAARRTELQRLEARRDELIKSVTTTRTRADAASKRNDDEGDVIRAGEEERQRSDRSLRELDDLKAKLAALDQRLQRTSDEPATPADARKRTKTK